MKGRYSISIKVVDCKTLKDAEFHAQSDDPNDLAKSAAMFVEASTHLVNLPKEDLKEIFESIVDNLNKMEIE
jgi:hypothetical protein